MMSRYSIQEHEKIEYYKYRIRELRYLQIERHNVKEDLKEIEFRLRLIPSPQIKQTYKSKYEYKNNCALWNELIAEKESLFIKEMNISNAICSIHRILDALTPNTRELAIDLLVNKKTVTYVTSKYNTRNPYQTINDELRHVEIDSF